MTNVFAEGATDPAAWGQALGAVNQNATIIAVSLIPWIAILLIWRGSVKLGIVGIGTEIKGDCRYVISLLEDLLDKKPRKPVLEEPEKPPAQPPAPRVQKRQA